MSDSQPTAAARPAPIRNETPRRVSADSDATAGGRWTVLMDRMAAMGFRSSCHEAPANDWLSVAELFPWWLHEVMHCDLDERRVHHLGKMLVARRHGLSQGAHGDLLAWQAFSAGLPVGTPAQVGALLLELVLENVAQDDVDWSDGQASAALVALDYLRRPPAGAPGGAGADSRAWAEDLFVTAVQAQMADVSKQQLALRSACRLVARAPVPQLADAIGNLVTSRKPDLVFEAAACLMRLGEQGASVLDSWPARAGNHNAGVVGAILEASTSHDLDGLDPYLNAGSDWQVRSSAARFVTDLAAVRSRPEAALEILLARLRVEEDNDTQATLADCLGEVLVAAGAEGSRRVVAMVAEFEGGGFSPQLLDGLMFGGCPGIRWDELEALRTPQMTSRGRNGAPLNRCLAWHGGIPASILDWTRGNVMRALQWGRPRLPDAVAAWFAAVPGVEGHHVTAALLRDVESAHTGALAAAFLAHHPEVVPVWEQLTWLQLNSGGSDAWTRLSSLLAGARHPVAVHPAELRAGIGADCAPPPPFSWAAVGRLVAVAASPISRAQQALRLLAGMGPEARELATHALATVPDGERAPSGMAALPPQHGIGPSRVLACSIGMPVARRPHPASFQHGHQPSFAVIPRAWRTGPRAIEGLRIAAVHQADWGAELIPWKNPEETRRVVAGVPVEAVQQVMIACAMSGLPSLMQLVPPLAAAVGPDCRQGDLGGVVGVIVDRIGSDPQLNGGGGAGTAGATPRKPLANPRPADCLDSGSDTDDIEALFGEYTWSD